MSYVCAYSSVQLDKSSVEKEFTSTGKLFQSLIGLSEFYELGLGPNLWYMYTFGGASLGRLGD